MKQMSRVAIVASVFACTTALSFGWSEQGGVSLSVESAQAQVRRPADPGERRWRWRRQTRRAVYGAGVVGAGAYYGGAGPYAYYGTGYGYNG